MIGAGDEFTVTLAEADAVHPPDCVTVTVYVPDNDMPVLCVVAPFDH